MIKKVSIFLFGSLFSATLFANELNSYCALKYQIDFEKQNPKTKESIQKEYERVKKLSKIIEESKLKNNVNLEVARDIATVDVWTNMYLQSYNPTQAELDELYKLEKPRVVAKYELRNILVSYENNADRIINSLNAVKNKDEKRESFIKYVRSVSNDIASKQNNGLTQLVDENKLNPQVKEALKDKKEGDIIKVNLKDLGTQIIFIEKIVPEKVANFAESKDALINLAKRKALAKEIDLLLK